MAPENPPARVLVLTASVLQRLKLTTLRELRDRSQTPPSSWPRAATMCWGRRTSRRPWRVASLSIQTSSSSMPWCRCSTGTRCCAASGRMGALDPRHRAYRSKKTIGPMKALFAAGR